MGFFTQMLTPAQLAWLARFAALGPCTMDRLVDHARPVDAPLHGLFMWDDEEAGDCWRDLQRQRQTGGLSPEDFSPAAATWYREWQAECLLRGLTVPHTTERMPMTNADRALMSSLTTQLCDSLDALTDALRDVRDELRASQTEPGTWEKATREHVLVPPPPPIFPAPPPRSQLLDPSL
jgi:hypothetical protein